MSEGHLKESAIIARSFIGHRIRSLRKGRSLSQGDLGKVLGFSQSALSEVELGHSSLSAEQFIQVLKFFNVQVSHFDPAPGAPGGALPKALAAHGATDLVEDPGLLPSERLERVDTVIRETLVAGEDPRALTALAPVIIHNIGQINLPKLFVRFKEFRLEHRYGWLIDNVLAAIALIQKDSPPRKLALTLAKAETALNRHRERFLAGTANSEGLDEDFLGVPVASPRTRHELLRTRSDFSKAWNILTALRVEDFAKAVKDSYAPDSH